MIGVEKFLFDLKFDAPPAQPDPSVVAEKEEEQEREPEPPPPPTFSEEELAEAKQAAYAQGRMEGERMAREQAAASREQHLAEQLQSLNATLCSLLSEEAARVAQSREMTLQIAIAIARKLLPEFTLREGAREVEQAIVQILPELMEEPRLTIRLGEAILEPVARKLEEIAAQNGYAGKLVFVGDATMGASDCLVEWSNGGMERDVARIWADVDRLAGDVLRANSARHSTMRGRLVDALRQQYDEPEEKHEPKA